MAEQKCPICGAEIPGDITGVLCPRCVLKEAMKEPSHIADGDGGDSSIEQPAANRDFAHSAMVQSPSKLIGGNHAGH